MSARGKVPTTASDLAFVPAGTIASTNVQAAIEEVAAEGGGGGGGAPSGPAGGVLGGTYPNPGFAVDMANQAELDAVASNTPTAGEKAALAGTSGTPGSGNKYVTDGDARNSDMRTPSDASVTLAKWASGVLDTDGTLAANSDSKVPTQRAVKTYTDALIAAADALVFKGAIDASSNPNYPAASAGHLYKISVAGKIGGASGPNVEVGDSLLCTVDGSAAGTHAAVGANWVIVQANLDGAVIGPATAVSGDFATFNGASGKLVQDSGLSLDTDNTLGANSDLRVPSQKAVKGYITTQTGLLIPKSLADNKGDMFVADANDSVVKLAVGSNGQVLTADSAQSAGVKWATPSAGSSVFAVPSAHIDPNVYAPLSPGTGITATTPQNSTPNSWQCVPFMLSKSVTLAVLAVNVTTAGSSGAAIRIGIYSDSSGRPGSLLVDLGQVAVDTTGVKDWTTSQALTAATNYWLITVLQVAVGALQVTCHLPQTQMGRASGSIVAGNALIGYDSANTGGTGTISGALPGTLNVGTTPNGSVGNAIRVMAKAA